MDRKKNSKNSDLKSYLIPSQVNGIFCCRITIKLKISDEEIVNLRCYSVDRIF